ncbi:hypothetical protein EST38_g2252 [Candolleomyces aberdarensis]|uniref:Uncharacterized protein n=1 Tax=Candolleomyces aberdarensis TaxID=2316362 RepID=A0A4Q2DW23_9AGAR|nr:hypothetical protein EST38_g2252 [Candolleomyces aberdarensis]
MLVTVGVALTTFSASQPSSSKSSVSSDLRTYITGIGILSLALVLSGFLGLLQEWTYKTYGGPSTTSGADNRPAWRESMFYLHFLSLPLFVPLLPEIKGQIAAINDGAARAETSIAFHTLSPTLVSFFPSIGGSMPPIPPPFSLPSLDFIIPPTFRNNTFAYFSSVSTTEATTENLVTLTLSLPKPYFPLLSNTLTQLLCVAGVHRLTTRVSNLTVTLILVVRKAVSLVISLKGRALWEELTRYSGVQTFMQEHQLGDGVWTSAAWFLKVALGVEEDEGVGKKRAVPEVDEGMLWTGAALVLLGTLGYTIGTGFRSSKGKAKKE